MYSLKDESGTFSISNTTGEVSLMRDLDREMSTNYLLNITAFDDAPEQFKYVTVNQLNVTITDINDNAPVFWNIPESPIEVLETLPGGEIITTLTANDSDEGKNSEISFAILETNCSRISILSNGSLYVNGEYVSIVTVGYECIYSYSYIKWL